MLQENKKIFDWFLISLQLYIRNPFHLILSIIFILESYFCFRRFWSYIDSLISGMMSFSIFLFSLILFLLSTYNNMMLFFFLRTVIFYHLLLSVNSLVIGPDALECVYLFWQKKKINFFFLSHTSYFVSFLIILSYNILDIHIYIQSYKEMYSVVNETFDVDLCFLSTYT